MVFMPVFWYLTKEPPTNSNVVLYRLALVVGGGVLLSISVVRRLKNK